MTLRDVAVDFAYQPPTSSSRETIAGSIIGPAQTFIAQNSLDSGPFGAAFTALTTNDTALTQGGFAVPSGNNFIEVGGVFYFVEEGIGHGMKLVVDWITAPAGTGTIDVQLITSASSSLSSPIVMLDFTALPIATFFHGYRQIQPLPRSALWLRYLGLQIVTTGTLTAGAYVAWIGLDVDSELLGYAEGFSIK